MRPKDWSKVDLLTIAAAGFPPALVKLLLEHRANVKETKAFHAAATTSAIDLENHVYETVASHVEVM